MVQRIGGHPLVLGAIVLAAHILAPRHLARGISGMVPDRGHGGYWRYVIAFVGVGAFAGALWLYLNPGEPYAPVDQHLEHQNPNYRPGGPKCEPKWLEGLSERLAKDKRQSCAESAEEHRLKANDLIQQTRSADAAEAVARLTYYQARVTRIGVIFGWLTLAAAIAAAWYAKRAASETGRSADIAQNTLIISERPYLALDIQDMRFIASHNSQEGIGDLWQWKLVNFGKGPARIVSVEVRDVYTEAGGMPESINTRAVGGKGIPSGIVVTQGSPYPMQVYDRDRFDATRSKAISCGELNAWLYGFVRYTGMTDVRYITGFCIRFDPVRQAQANGGDNYNFFREEDPAHIPDPEEFRSGSVPFSR